MNYSMVIMSFFLSFRKKTKKQKKKKKRKATGAHNLIIIKKDTRFVSQCWHHVCLATVY